MNINNSRPLIITVENKSRVLYETIQLFNIHQQLRKTTIIKSSIPDLSYPEICDLSKEAKHVITGILLDCKKGNVPKTISLMRKNIFGNSSCFGLITDNDGHREEHKGMYWCKRAGKEGGFPIVKLGVCAYVELIKVPPKSKFDVHIYFDQR